MIYSVALGHRRVDVVKEVEEIVLHTQHQWSSGLLKNGACISPDTV